MSSIVTRIEKDVAVLLLNEPKTHHALSRSLVLGLHQALDASDVQKARAIVIASTGPNFCAGANISDLLDGWMDGHEPESDPVGLFSRIANDPRPTIAAVGGGALGGGFELMLSCDLAVASPDAWFSLPELGHGVIPNTALMRLQQMIGLRQTMYLVMTGKRISSASARALGIVNDVVQDDVLSAAISLAQSVVDKVAPGAFCVAKRFAHQYGASDWASVQASLQKVPREQWAEGLSAFEQKRVPNYDRFWKPVLQPRPSDHQTPDDVA